MKNLNEEIFGVVNKENRFVGVAGESKSFWEAYHTKNDIFFFYTKEGAERALSEREKLFKLKNLRVVQINMSVQFIETNKD